MLNSLSESVNMSYIHVCVYIKFVMSICMYTCTFRFVASLALHLHVHVATDLKFTSIVTMIH